jgi:ligand-binding sensor domain-containing protein/serine phosphatase RsbU (regulator of sigma subunit)
MLRHYCIILLAALSLVMRAQTYHFASYEVKDGLIQSNVSSIVQDSAGFYWIGTAGGLSRFDGRHFVNYTTENGLADNNVTALFIDREQQLWIGHDNGSVTRFTGDSFVTINSKQLPRDKKIFGFFQDKQGDLWIHTAAAGAIRIMDVSRKASKGRHIRTYTGKDGLSQYVLNVAQDAEGNMWFCTDIAVKVLRRGSGTFEFFSRPDLPPGHICSMAKTRDGKLLFGTLTGNIFLYDPTSSKVKLILGTGDLLKKIKVTGQLLYIYTLLEDSKGNIWASITNIGVIRIDKNGNTTWFNTNNGLTVNKIKAIIEDREGNILFGTDGEGIEVFSGEKFVSYSKHNGLSDNQVWAICRDRTGQYWFGTNEGITIYNPSAPEEKAYRTIGVKDGLPNNNIKAITEDKSGHIWIAMWGGKVIRADAATGRLTSLPALDEIVNNYAWCLLVDSKNLLWIGTNEGIVRYDLSSGAIKTFRTIDGLVDNDISCFHEDSKGNIWIGTKKRGISVYDGKKFRNYDKTTSALKGNVSAISEDTDDNIWIGTEGAGALVYDGKAFNSFKSKDGLSSDFVTLVAPDKKGNMWLGTNKGLNKYSKQAGFVNYTEGEGFTGLETKQGAVFTDKNGEMWFGTVNGVFRYRPDADESSPTPPRVKMLQFKVNLKEAPVQKQVELSYKENNLAFDFIGIWLNNPIGVTYKVKMEGVEDDYRIIRHNTEVFSNLSPGKYQFSLIACNNAGVCSQPFTMSITITPPYWKRWWFYLIVAVLASAILFLYIKVRERKLMNEKRILEEKVNERTAEVVQKNKELDEINKDITASIRYAKRIQDAILPPDEYVRQHLPECFVLFKPKDIVSGDFYFMEKKDDVVIFAAVDCTGHGVPGAFMSIVGHNLLDRVIGEQNITQPARILDELNRSLSDTLRQTNLEDNTVRDGMDVALCAYRREKNVLEFAGAYNPLWLLRNNELIEIKANKFPIGNSKAGEGNKFTNHEITLQKGDCIYIFSDGYADQFGGPSGKKFKASAVKNLLLTSQQLTMKEQREVLNTAIEQWRGQHEQVDDILVIGARFN